MERIGLVIFSNLVALAAVIGAIFLAYHEKDGWGWMVFIALLSTQTWSFNSRKDDGDCESTG